MKIYLFGDSILDNGPYVGEENSVSKVLQRVVEESESIGRSFYDIDEDESVREVVNYARDGYTVHDVYDQLGELEVEPADYAILSVGGNDLLMCSTALMASYGKRSLKDQYKNIAENFDAFQKRWKLGLNPKECIFVNIFNRYEAIRQRLLKKAHRVIFLNLYCPVFEEYDEEFSEIAPLVVDTFNSILGAQYGSDNVVRLSEIVKLKEDFVNTIEPSAIGTKKIVKAIVEKIERDSWSKHRQVSDAYFSSFIIMEKNDQKVRRRDKRLNPNPKFFKYTYYVFTRKSKLEGREFFEKSGLSIFEAFQKMKQLQRRGELFIVYNSRIPRSGPDTPFNENKSDEWAPPYDEDPDTPYGELGHK